MGGVPQHPIRSQEPPSIPGGDAVSSDVGAYSVQGKSHVKAVVDETDLALLAAELRKRRGDIQKVSRSQILLANHHPYETRQEGALDDLGQGKASLLTIRDEQEAGR
jgi:hypothetical protein